LNKHKQTSTNKHEQTKTTNMYKQRMNLNKKTKTKTKKHHSEATLKNVQLQKDLQLMTAEVQRLHDLQNKSKK